MTEHAGAPSPDHARTRAGVFYAVLAGGSATLLLFLPVLLLGFTASVVAAVLQGDIVAWRGSVDMTYTFIGLPALLALILLVVPYRLFRAAGSHLGISQAIRWVGGLLAGFNLGVALIWIVKSRVGSTPPAGHPELWYAVAFATTAVVSVVGLIVAERHAVRVARALVGGMAVALIALGAVLVAVWGSPPRIPPGAQTVHVAVSGSVVRLAPATVRAGETYFVMEGLDDLTQHAEVAFVSAGYGSQCCSVPRPLSDEGAARLAQGDYQGTATEGGWGKYAKFTLLQGKYAFLTFGPEGQQPSAAPDAIAILEVLP
jgi:hypothetical protein